MAVERLAERIDCEVAPPDVLIERAGAHVGLARGGVVALRAGAHHLDDKPVSAHLAGAEPLESLRRSPVEAVGEAGKDGHAVVTDGEEVDVRSRASEQPIANEPADKVRLHPGRGGHVLDRLDDAVHVDGQRVFAHLDAHA